MLRRKAFTLVELLVVIGILAVLIAILLPALSGAKRVAQRVACAAQMRQVGQALHIYANDHKGFLPLPALTYQARPEDWVHWQPGRDLNQSPMAKYLARDFKILRCPADTAERRELRAYPFSYGLNRMLCDSSWPFNITKVRQPTIVILLVDIAVPREGGWWGWLYGGGRDWNYAALRHWQNNEMADVDYHKRMLIGRSNVIFVDGHYEYLERWWTTDAAHADPRWGRETSVPIVFPPDWKMGP